MPRTPERSRSESVTEELQLDDVGTGGDPTEVGEFRLVNGELLARDQTGNFNLRSGGGITEANHRTIDQLVHALDEDHFVEYTYNGSRVTLEEVWDSPLKTTRIRRYSYTWSGGKVTQEVAEQFDGAGVLVETLTTTYAYSGNKVTSETVVRS